MKKLLKISAVGLIIFALVTNLYGAMFSFYGIKTNNLEGAVWASSLSTTDGSGDGTGTGTSSWWDSPVNRVVHCEAMPFSGDQTNHGAASVSYTTDAYGKITASVSYASSASSSYSGTVAAHDATMRQCTGNGWAICTTITAVEACQ